MAQNGFIIRRDKNRSPSAARVLVVDDNPDFRASLAVLLRSDGHEVRCARDGTQAICEALCWPPDLVLLDVYMPGPDGFAIARKLREDCPDPSMLVVMTSAGDLDEATLACAGEARFDRCIDKTDALAGVQALLADRFPGPCAA